MHALIVYESMYGNTHTIAEGIAVGLRPRAEVRVVPVSEASQDHVEWADLVIAGGPTHVHGMVRPSTRKGASEAAAKPDSGLTLEPDATGPGLHEWFASLANVSGKRAAAFDTRIDAPALVTGRASNGIAKELKHHGFTLVAKSESFLVDRHSKLVAEEAERAALWGATLSAELSPTA
jgi:Flavodoxin domain